MPPYPILVDLFVWGRYAAGGGSVWAVKGLQAPVVEESWTAQDVLEYVRGEVKTRPGRPYDVVGFRAEPEEIGWDPREWVLEEDAVLVRVPRSARVVDVMPTEQPIRVTNSEFGPYRFVDLPE